MRTTTELSEPISNQAVTFRSFFFGAPPLEGNSKGERQTAADSAYASEK